jgi:hypothetical protein
VVHRYNKKRKPLTGPKGVHTIGGLRKNAGTKSINSILKLALEKVVQLQETQNQLQVALREGIGRVPSLLTYQTPPLHAEGSRKRSSGNLGGSTLRVWPSRIL